MSVIEESLVEHLNGVGAITALVGTKIFPGLIPQGTALPLISFTSVGGGPVHSLVGASSLEMRLYRFDIWADKNEMDEILSISGALQTALDGFRGLMGTTYQLTVQRIMLNNIRDDFEPDSESLRRMMEFDVDYNP